MVVPSFRRDYTTAVKNAIRRTDTVLGRKVDRPVSECPQDAAANRPVRLGPVALLGLQFGHVPGGLGDAQDRTNTPVLPGLPEEDGVPGGNLIPKPRHRPADS